VNTSRKKYFTYLQSADQAGKIDERLLTDINVIVQETHILEKSFWSLKRFIRNS
jgi:hypothetical protein